MLASSQIQGALTVITTDSSSAMSAVVKSKPNIAPNELAVACTINSFFTIVSLVEFSADSWATPDLSATVPLEAEARSRLQFLAQFYQWRADDPIIGKIMMGLLVPLPFLLVAFVTAVLQTLFGWRRASRTRHVADVLQAFTLFFVILPTVVKELVPAQDGLVASCAAATYGSSPRRSVEWKCLESSFTLLWVHKKMLFFNMAMFAYDVAKFAGNMPPPEATLASGTKMPGEMPGKSKNA